MEGPCVPSLLPELWKEKGLAEMMDMVQSFRFGESWPEIVSQATFLGKFS